MKAVRNVVAVVAFLTAVAGCSSSSAPLNPPTSSSVQSVTNQASSSLPPSAEQAFVPAPDGSANVTIPATPLTDSNKYKTIVSGQISLSAPAKDVSNSAPGQAVLTVDVGGQFTIQNGLPDRNLPAEDVPGLTVAGLWPAKSTLCQILGPQAPGGPTPVTQFSWLATAATPPGGDLTYTPYCVIRIGYGTTLTANPAPDSVGLGSGGATGIAAGGAEAMNAVSVSGGYGGPVSEMGIQMWSIDEARYSSLAADLAAGPAAWLLLNARETQSDPWLPDTGSCILSDISGDSGVLWSSAPAAFDAAKCTSR